MAGILGWTQRKGQAESSLAPLASPPEGAHEALLAALLRAQAHVLEQAIRSQGLKLQQAQTLMAEAVQAFGAALQELDVLAKDQYQLAMELLEVLEVRLEGEAGAQSVEDFTTRILSTLDLFVQAMLEIGQSSFQLVEETEGIRSRSAQMVEALDELAEVALRTQMLALNASIEAAHARQYGAGFAVVAGEVQKLADRSGRISDQISSQVHSTEAALDRTTLQVQIIASKDLNEIIRSKQLAENMIKAISQSELQAQQLVARMEEVGRKVKAQVGLSIQALQFEDMVRQVLQGVTTGTGQLARFALSIRTLADAVAEQRSPLGDLLAQATLEFEAFSREVHEVVQAASMSSGEVDLF